MSTTTLTQKYKPSDNAIVVADSTVLGSAPNTLKITNAQGKYVTLSYNSIVGNILYDIVVTGGNGRLEFGIGSVVSDALDKYTSIPELSEAVEKLEQGGGGGGTTNYELLTNKPKINYTELIGNKTLEDIGAVEYSTRTTAHPSMKIGYESDDKIYLVI